MTWPGTGRAAWLLVAVVLVVTGQLQAWLGPEDEVAGGRPLESFVVAAATVPLLLPLPALPMLVVVFSAGMASYAMASELGQFWFALVLALYRLGAQGGRVAGLVGTATVMVGVLAMDLPRLREGARIEDVVPAWFILAAAFGFGRWVRTRRVEQAELRARTEAAEREHLRATREAVAHERAVIARELHDLVGHSLAVIVLQAEAAGRVMTSDPVQARTAVDAVARLGREGLDELRRLLGVLVAPDDEELPALPTLDNLEGLVERFCAAGLPVTLRVDGAVRPLPPGLDLSAYRIVQEALTNTLKHAGPTEASVDVSYQPDALELVVADQGAGARGTPDGRVGRGLIGMRERVALFGGELEAGDGPVGGFEVRARIPLAP